MSVSEFFDAIREANTVKPGTHTLHPGTTSEAIEEWQQGQGANLPADLIAVLKRSNGVGLQQDWYGGEPIYREGAYRIFPLDQIRPAVRAMYGRDVADEKCFWWYAFGEGPEGARYFVFDRRTGGYLAVAPIVPDEAETIGPSLGPIFRMMLGKHL